MRFTRCELERRASKTPVNNYSVSKRTESVLGLGGGRADPHLHGRRQNDTTYRGKRGRCNTHDEKVPHQNQEWDLAPAVPPRGFRETRQTKGKKRTDIPSRGVERLMKLGGRKMTPIAIQNLRKRRNVLLTDQSGKTRANKCG